MSEVFTFVDATYLQVRKNKDLDRWYTKIRCPYERIFSQPNKRVLYRGGMKN